jgi:hypothetical protein
MTKVLNSNFTKFTGNIGALETRKPFKCKPVDEKKLLSEITKMEFNFKKRTGV